MSDSISHSLGDRTREMVRLKKVSPVELVDIYAKRIEELNPTLAVSHRHSGRAPTRRNAPRPPSTATTPPFHGVPISIKDLNETEGADDARLRRVRRRISITTTRSSLE